MKGGTPQASVPSARDGTLPAEPGVLASSLPGGLRVSPIPSLDGAAWPILGSLNCQAPEVQSVIR
eukprot:12585382-Alexandrium_andersonii.AAC.1